jgi:hypothetical protein
VFLKITEVTKNFGPSLFHGKHYVSFVLANKGLGNISVDFFTNSSGHPASRSLEKPVGPSNLPKKVFACKALNQSTIYVVVRRCIQQVFIGGNFSSMSLAAPLECLKMVQVMHGPGAGF